METKNLELVARALYGQKENEQEKFLTKVLELIAGQKTSHEEFIKLVCKEQYSMFPNIYWQMNFETIAAIVEAVAVADLQQTPDWFDALSDLFAPEAEMEKYDRDVCAGVILGVFNSFTIIDKIPNRAPGLEISFRRIIENVIINRNKLLEYCLNTNSFSDHAEKENNKIRGKLSEAIKRFVYAHMGYKPYRLKEIAAIISQVNSRIEAIKSEFLDYERCWSFSKKYGPTKIGEFIAEQLTYVLFTEINAVERIQSTGFLISKKQN